jgi:hypothetical protein
MKRPTDKQIRKAMEILERDGRSSRQDPNDISRARAIGNALYGQLEPKECAEAAMESLEQWNGHLSVAAIDAIEFGRGTVTRNGRDLHIILPEHWGESPLG